MPDMMAALEALLTIIPRELANGNIVELGELGHFWLRISAEGVEDAADVRGEQITTLIPRFMPGRQFRNVLANVKFKKRR